MIYINTASRYSDLGELCEQDTLFEDKCGVYDLADKLNKLEDEEYQKTFHIQNITTLNEFVINYIGHLIAEKKLHYYNFTVRVYENGSVKKLCPYCKEGYLLNWDLGLYNPD